MSWVHVLFIAFPFAVISGICGSSPEEEFHHLSPRNPAGEGSIGWTEICGGSGKAQYGNAAPSISMVKKWFTEYRCGRTSTSDAERSARPKEVITPEIVNKIHGIILDDRRVKLREVAEAVGISAERLHYILHEYLDMKKLSARWVPRLLTLDHKRNLVTTSKECWTMFNRNPSEFLRSFVTADEPWIHHNTPETKEQSKQWFSSGEHAPKKAKVGLSANKVTATVFWDARGIIQIDYLQKGKKSTLKII
ncbi:uncharacterized protein LOC117176706 [Belonocnema kinseyi]|uniref:uncharacterized protein LOC117176706 n=1 Tax=Belonocnema kinseyi TaxID=2817044 RepID=UPI00143D6959|nr:uncharacterized protein LOC117176706 [Belonocnema kinseyi]